MSRLLNQARQTCRRSRNFAIGLLIGAGVATPAFAATELTTDDWRTLSLTGFVVLLGVGLVLKVRQKRLPKLPVWPAPTGPSRHTIGEDRPNAYH